jgi:hypothetical protein
VEVKGASFTEDPNHTESLSPKLWREERKTPATSLPSPELTSPQCTLRDSPARTVSESVCIM